MSQPDNCSLQVASRKTTTEEMGSVQLSFCALCFTRKTVPRSQDRQSPSTSLCLLQESQLFLFHSSTYPQIFPEEKKHFHPCRW